jgi:hypothetical protein
VFVLDNRRGRISGTALIALTRPIAAVQQICVSPFIDGPTNKQIFAFRATPFRGSTTNHL